MKDCEKEIFVVARSYREFCVWCELHGERRYPLGCATYVSSWTTLVGRTLDRTEIVFYGRWTDHPEHGLIYEQVEICRIRAGGSR
jgi:hypothetical protein